MTASIAQALIRWCESNTAPRSPGVSLKFVGVPIRKGKRERVKAALGRAMAARDESLRKLAK